MSMDLTTFTNRCTLKCMSYWQYANRATELTAISTALGTDTTVHDKTIEAAPVGLQAGNAGNSPFTNAILISVNKGKGGNLTVAQMATVLTNLAAAPPNPSPM